MHRHFFLLLGSRDCQVDLKKRKKDLSHKAKILFNTPKEI